MHRSMMQMYVKNSMAALAFYKKAFNAELLCEYPHEDGKGYMHAELNAHGQVLAISEAFAEVVTGNAVQFCLHFGEVGEEHVITAYEVLKDGAKIDAPMGPCPYSPLMFSLVDRYGVYWCVFV